MNMEEFYQAFTDSISEDAENIMPNDSNAELQYSQMYSVRVPKPEDKILMDASCVREVKAECEKAKKVQFPYAEVCLGISSLLLGAFFSAILSQVTYEFELLSIFFYTICPVGGVGAGVAYWFCRKKDTMDVKALAEKVEGYFKNFDEVEEDR